MKPFCNILYLFSFNQDCGLFVTTPPYPIKTIPHNSQRVPVSAECKQMAKGSEVRIRPHNPLSNLKSPRPGTAYHCQSHLLLELAHDISHGPAAIVHPLLLSEKKVRVEIGTTGLLQGFLLSAQHDGPLRRGRRRVTMELRQKNTRKGRRKWGYRINEKSTRQKLTEDKKKLTNLHLLWEILTYRSQ